MAAWMVFQAAGWRANRYGERTMSDYLGMSAQLAGNAVRFGWFSGLNWLMDRQRARLGGETSRYRPVRPVPSRDELFAELRRLLIADAAFVRDGLLPPGEDEPEGLVEHLARLRAMLRDLPESLERRETMDTATARSEAAAAGLPDYFTQDFHFQTGGYLSEGSARLYDVQVETLFYGSAAAMRRAALRPIAEHMRGRDQRRTALLDVACGTGRFLRQARLAWPAMTLAGLDLSAAYLREADRHLAALRPVRWIEANAEEMPLPDASQDIVTSVYLFHELPPDVRRRVVREMARVLKPGGLLVLVDSLQMGDRPGWDGLLEAFPVRFHEPYYRHYAIDDLDAMLSAAGLVPVTTELAFMSKVIVRVAR
jgi:ubiquinone/menaquinone biosynthesis C-methylase UbiE